MVRHTSSRDEVIEAAVATCVEQILDSPTFTECCKGYIEETVEKAVAKAVAKALEKREFASLSEGRMPSKNKDTPRTSTATSSKDEEESEENEENEENEAGVIWINPKSNRCVYHNTRCGHVKAETKQYRLCFDCIKKHEKLDRIKRHEKQ